MRMSNVVLDDVLIRGALEHVAVEHVGLIPGVSGIKKDVKIFGSQPIETV